MTCTPVHAPDSPHEGGGDAATALPANCANHLVGTELDLPAAPTL